MKLRSFIAKGYATTLATALVSQMAKPPETKQLIKAAANKLASTLDADLLILNYEILPPIDFFFADLVSKRKAKRNVILFLTTEGGSADSAFRMMRCLQSVYSSVSVVVCGWCKSAGTLMCIGAHNLFIGPSGELGPLDVQIVKADEMDEQKSGLVAEAAFEKLQQESYKFFMSFVKDIGASDYRVTLKTAFDIASKMTVGVIEPIFDKLDPVTIGEDYRSNRLAQAYAERLNVHSRNLVRTQQLDALENLLSSYPSHGFVIDAREAKTLFKNVLPIPAEMDSLLALLSGDVKYPRNKRQGQGPRLEFLNDDTAVNAKATATSTSRQPRAGSKRTGPSSRRKGAKDGSRNPSERGGAPARIGSNGIEKSNE